MKTLLDGFPKLPSAAWLLPLALLFGCPSSSGDHEGHEHDSHEHKADEHATEHHGDESTEGHEGHEGHDHDEEGSQ